VHLKRGIFSFCQLYTSEEALLLRVQLQEAHGKAELCSACVHSHGEAPAEIHAITLKLLDHMTSFMTSMRMHRTSSQPGSKRNNRPLTGKGGDHGDQLVFCADSLKPFGLLLR
jgi:hypothetical protein